MATYDVVDGVGIIPPGTERIEERAFYSNKGLKSVVIPDSVTEIGSEAFAFCSALTDVRFSNSLEKIGLGAFRECPISSINLPSSLKKIDSSAFYDTKITSVVIPAGLLFVDRLAFFGCPIESLVVEDGNAYYDSRDNCNAIIKTFYDKLIRGCMNTVIPPTVTSIDVMAFGKCPGLKQITVPTSVVEVADYAFHDNEHLETVTFEGVEIKMDKEGLVFSKCPSLKTINIPVKKLAYYKRKIDKDLHGLLVEPKPSKPAKKAPAKKTACKS